MRNAVVEALRAERRALKAAARQSIEEARRARHLLQATHPGSSESSQRRSGGEEGRPSPLSSSVS
jgi:hypothetical protein